jgi:hypothetical protein
VPRGHELLVTELGVHFEPDDVHSLPHSGVLTVELTNQRMERLGDDSRTAGIGGRATTQERLGWGPWFPRDTLVLSLYSTGEGSLALASEGWPKHRVSWRGFLVRGKRDR